MNFKTSVVVVFWGDVVVYDVDYVFCCYCYFDFYYQIQMLFISFHSINIWLESLEPCTLLLLHKCFKNTTKSFVGSSPTRWPLELTKTLEWQPFLCVDFLFIYFIYFWIFIFIFLPLFGVPNPITLLKKEINLSSLLYPLCHTKRSLV